MMRQFKLGLIASVMVLGAVVARPAAADYSYGKELPSDGNGPGASSVITDLNFSQLSYTNSAAPLETRLTQIAKGTSNLSVASTGTSVGNSGFAGESGIAGQGGQRRWGLWLNGAYSDIDYDKTNLKFNGDTYSLGMGVDYLIMDNIVIGLAATYENTDLKLKSALGKYDRDGWTLSPYVAFRLGQYFTLTGALGFSWLDSDASTGVGGSEKYDTDRWFATTNLGFNYPIGQWRLGANVGYLYIDEEDDAHTTGNGFTVGRQSRSIAQGRLGAQVGYDFGGITPYIMGRLEHEFITTDGVNLTNGGGVVTQSVKPDRTGFVFGLGANFAYGAISGGLLATTQEGRDSLDVYTLSGNIRIAF